MAIPERFAYRAASVCYPDSADAYIEKRQRVCNPLPFVAYFVMNQLVL
jgi:hypothetical protein